MAEALKRKSSLAIKAESAYGTDPTIASTNVIEFVDFTLESTRGEITRDVIRNTLDELEPVLGDEEAAGNIQIELHGSGTPGTAPESSPLWKAAFGVETSSPGTSVTVANDSDVTTIDLDTGDGADHAVGQAILIDPLDGTAYEVVFITDITGDTLTVSPDLSVDHATAITIGAGTHYSTSTAGLDSLWAEYWRGDLVRETYKGLKVENLTCDFAIGAATNPTFAMQGQAAEDPVTEAYGLGAPTYDSGNVHVGRYMVIKVGGTSYPLEALSFTLNNSLYRRKALTTAGTSNIIQTARMVTGSFTLAYENKDVEQAFRDGTTAELMLVSSTGDPTLVSGNTFACWMPKIKYTEVPKGETEGIYQYNVAFKAILTSGEDTIYASFV
jgi:hypothetical protein